MSNARRKELTGTGRGAVGKVAVVGVKDRDTKKVRAKVTQSVTAPALQGFVAEHTAPARPSTRTRLPPTRDCPSSTRRSSTAVSEYVRDMAHVNGVESFWSMLKRAHKGTFHKMSPKHLDRYVTEFAGKHNLRESDTEDQLVTVAQRMDGKRLRYKDLIAPNGLDSGARS